MNKRRSPDFTRRKNAILKPDKRILLLPPACFHQDLESISDQSIQLAVSYQISDL